MMRSYSPVFLASAVLIALSGSSFADTYSSSSSTVVTSGPRTTMPMTPAANGDLTTIRSCLCLQSRYQTEANTVASKQAAYTQAVNQKNSYDTMVANARTGTSPMQLAQVKQASENSIIMMNQINQSYLPDLQNATAQYNQSVASYQQSCVGKAYDAGLLAQAKSGLVCE